MSRQQELHFKDRCPEDTVAYIQELLQELGIEVEEYWVPKSSANTYSMRVNIKGTSLGSNGKGVSEVYTKASAYAEFMERLQNDILTLLPKYPKRKEGFWQFPDEKHVTARELAEMDNSFMQHFFECHEMKDATVEEKEKYILTYHKMESFLNGAENSYEVRPFYNVGKKKVEYLPYYFYLLHHGSNGMSAGNTPEEALVQGISEIFERHVQEKIFLEKPSLPDIPDEYIQQYPYIWERVELLRQIKGIKIFMKDCSFGGKYPVAALIVVDENTGNYGVKLGCHPDYGIAMERTITETAQGNDFFEYAKRSTLDFEDKDVSLSVNIYNSFKMGYATYPFEIFKKESTWEFTPVEDVSQMSNKEILIHTLDKIQGEGYEIFIRDVSYTGFPSFHIVIPGLSEIMKDYSTLYLKSINTKAYLIPYLNYPERIYPRIAKLIRGNMDFLSGSHIENGMTKHYCVYPDFSFPGEEVGIGWLYMSAICCYYLKEYAQAAERVHGVLLQMEQHKCKTVVFYRGVYHYMKAKSQGLSHEEIMECMEVFFDQEICRQLTRIFREPEQVFTMQYPTYDYLGKDGEMHCPDGEYATWISTKSKMIDYMLQHPIDQNRIAGYVEVFS